MPNIGPVELVIILVIALLVIGPGKLPDVGSALGKSIREFRKAASDVQESVKLDAPVPPAAPAPVAPAPVAPAPTVPPPPVAAVPDVSVPNTLAAAATPNQLNAPAAPDPAAPAAEEATEARV
jgi:sec-independent protein translocase protein TatA